MNKDLMVKSHEKRERNHYLKFEILNLKEQA
jgi:hypothetical protein